jgi:tripartite-type tricarboxylate transporter receptor subunit TctC
LIAPFAAGGSTDLVARVISEGLRAKLGQPVIVENKPGGTGVIGAREVVKADPDGYTLLLANAGATVIPAAMSRNYPIDLNKDLLAIGLTAEFVGVVIAKKDLPVNSMQEFIAYAKANPGKLNFGTSGVGSMVHLAAELLMKETGIKMQHLPYKGGSNSMTDLLGGTIDALFVSSPVAVGQADNKNLKMLAVTSRYRLQALPNVSRRAACLASTPRLGWASWGLPAYPQPSVKSSARPWWTSRGTRTPRPSCARSGSSRSAKTRRRSRNSSAATSRSGRTLSRTAA